MKLTGRLENKGRLFLLLCATWAGGALLAETVNALAPYDNTQNTAFWNTTERVAGVTASAQSSATVTLAGTGGSAGTLAAAFDSRPGTSEASAPRSLYTTKGRALFLSFR